MGYPKSTISVFFLALFLAVGLMFSSNPADAASMKTNINAASMEQLEAVKGIGHDTAQNILAYKKEHGSFSTIKELENVTGVGSVRLEALQEAFTVESKKAVGKVTTKK